MTELKTISVEEAKADLNREHFAIIQCCTLIKYSKRSMYRRIKRGDFFAFRLNSWFVLARVKPGEEKPGKQLKLF